jgi:hypothetical protein
VNGEASPRAARRRIAQEIALISELVGL